MSDIRALWSRLETWANEHAPQLLSKLNPAATADRIHSLESELKLTLPDSFKASLAIHDGEDGAGAVFAGRGDYLSTSRILEEWRSRQGFGEDLDGDPEELAQASVISVEGPVQPKMFLPDWVPILDCDGNFFVAIDFAPAERGEVGQIIEVDWEGCSWRVVANSFDEFFERYVAGLEAGDYREAVAVAAGSPEALLDDSSVRRFRLTFGSIVFFLGLMLWRSAESSWFYLGVLSMAWGGWIVGRQLLSWFGSRR